MTGVVRHLTRALPVIVALQLLVANALAQPTSHWSSGAPMPSSRTEVAVVAVAGKIYVAGGFGGDPEVEIYDPAIDRWSRGAPLPQPLHHAAAVELDGKLYIVGGFSGGWSPVDSLYAYDPELDRWEVKAPLPTARGGLAAVVLDGKIHALSGAGERRRNTPAHEVYDPASDSWSKRAPLPTPRDHLAAAVVNGKIYAIGGRIDGSYARNLAMNELLEPGGNPCEEGMGRASAAAPDRRYHLHQP